MLRAEGYEVVLVNSNPATIMTDPEFADATYVEPINAEYVAKIIEREKPDACLPTLGGQTGLNVAMDLANSGVLEAHGVELIGAGTESIRRAEDRQVLQARRWRRRASTFRVSLRLLDRRGPGGRPRRSATRS